MSIKDKDPSKSPKDLIAKQHSKAKQSSNEDVSGAADVEVIRNQGKPLFERFELLEVLGKGNISSVFKCIDRNNPLRGDDEFVTVKVLHRRFRKKQDWLELVDALRKYRSFDHPNIIRIEDFGYNVTEGKGFIITEYLAGQSLGKMIRSWREHKIKPKLAARVVNEIGKALTYAHVQGTVHGDLKPANVFLTDQNQVKVMDFGLVQALNDIAKSKTDIPQFGPNNHSASSPSYASPELLDTREADLRDDVYGLACITYEMLTGEHPYGRVRSTGAQEFKLEVKPSDVFNSAQWQSLCKALALGRDNRTPTVAEFLAGFNGSKGAPSGSNWVRPAAMGAIFLAIVATISVLFGGFYTPSDEQLPDSANLTPSLGSEQPDRELVTDQQTGSQSDIEQSSLVKRLQSELAELARVEEAFIEQEPEPTEVVEQINEPPVPKVAEASTEPKPVVKPVIKPKPKVSKQDAIDSLVTKLLAVAERQMQARRLTLPEGNNALSTYQNLLKQVPGQKDALRGIQSIKAQYNTWSDDARKKGNWKNAREQARKAAAIEPRNNADLQARLKRIDTAKAAADRRAQQAAAAARAKQLAQQRAKTISNYQGIVVINEIMAHNDLTLADAQGEYDDWLEFFNRSPKAVDLSGFYLSDDPQEPKKWQFPSGSSIAANGYLIVWADRSADATDFNLNPPEIHTNFNLSPRSGNVLLVGPDRNGNNIVDQVSYGRQREDQSVGRFPNGLGDFSDKPVLPTPRAPNRN